MGLSIFILIPVLIPGPTIIGSWLKYFLIEFVNEYIILGTTEAIIISSISSIRIFEAFKKLNNINPYSSEVRSNFVVKR